MDGIEIFKQLSAVNVGGKTDNKQGLTYLSWSHAWAETCKLHNVTYKITKNSDGLPYFNDDKTGYMVFTNVTIEGITHEMWLCVMDSSNKAMKSAPYEYTVRSGKKSVQQCTMFDINKTIMRCLVKNLAMFGLGLNVYAGEDLPMTVELDNLTPDHQDWKKVLTGVKNGKNREYVEQYYKITNDIWSALNS